MMRWLGCACVLTGLVPSVVLAAENGVSVNSNLKSYVAAREREFDSIPDERKEILAQLVAHVQSRRTAGEPVRLTFICTHNSRRSHLTQIWAATAAAHYGISNVTTYSGGTEATAFNPRAVAALQRAGFEIAAPAATGNPRYLVMFSAEAPSLECFSKVYNEAPNPQSDYCAVMTCSDADQKCPIVAGATTRIALKYDDPKAFDDTPLESAKYDERCAQIARELLYAFSLVK